MGFFVFVTPYLAKWFFDGRSVMMDVATSGGSPTADYLWCEKYPNVEECKGGDPMPMLLSMPRINDYRGGMGLLGLGDIVLPGLLMGFASRLDEARSVMGVAAGKDERWGEKKRRFKSSYFIPVNLVRCRIGHVKYCRTRYENGTTGVVIPCALYCWMRCIHL